MRVGVVIPAYNEEKAIGPLVREISRKGLDCIVIDDGSSDKTKEVAAQEGAYLISHSKNIGKGASLIDGFKYILDKRYDYVITMDADGQHNPDEIDNFLKAAEGRDVQIVIGNRMQNPQNMPLIRRSTNRFMSFFISLITRQSLPDSQCGFRLIKTDVLKQIALTTTKYEIESELLIAAARAGFKINSIPIKSIYRGQKSQIRPFADSIRFIALIFRMAFKWQKD